LRVWAPAFAGVTVWGRPFRALHPIALFPPRGVIDIRSKVLDSTRALGFVGP